MLKDYEKKRDFSQTREPKPSEEGAPPGGLRYVIQKHAARRLHYDFRLELDGVLKSWAVPKGPSVDPQEKRLAVLVEDHPVDYGTFEGVIGHGNYGAGQVIVWDAGIYSPDEGGHLSFGDREDAEERMRRDLMKGKLSFTLRGQKLQGSWTLVKTARSPNDWLLIKHKDAHADSRRNVLDEERSVQSGLTLADLKAGRLPDPAASQDQGPQAQRERVLALGWKDAFPTRLKPMLARSADGPFSHPNWLFEPKLDGYRALTFVNRGKATVLTRNGIDFTARLPLVVAELEAQPDDSMVLDGELVALDSQGLPDFGLLQQAINLGKGARQPGDIVYYPFDLLHLDGTNLLKVPLFERKALLKHALVPGDYVRSIEYVDAEGDSFLKAVLQMGLEGMVAKRRDSPYQPGNRSPSWLKVKAVQEEDFVVGGYTEGAGARSSAFGALLVGNYRGGDLHFTGRVGSGFDDETLRDMKETLSELRVDSPPFAADPELVNVDHRWVRPELVARVKFAEWTKDGRLRAPVFVGLRPDLDPKDVKPEGKVVHVSSKAVVPSAQPDRARVCPTS